MSNELSPIIDYPLNERGSIVSQYKGLTKRRPSLSAPPANQPGSVDWSVKMMFGDVEKGVQMVESLVAGQGSAAQDKWVQFCILYREWEMRFREGELVQKPTLNQVCHALDFPADQFLGELQIGIQSVMSKVGRLKAAMATPALVDKAIEVALSDEADVKDRELALKLGGMIEEKGGVQVNVNQQQAVVLKGEKDRMKAPLLQFHQTVEAIDEEVRSTSE